MKKTKILASVCLLFLSATGFAQQQIEDTYKKYEPIIPERKQELLKNVDVIANMRFGFNNYFIDDKYTESKFNNDQFRMEIRGKVHEKVSFRWRNRYTREPVPGDLDNLTRSTDLAFIQLELSDRDFIRAGKMCADWGGVEFDLNPIDIYMYNDILEYADNFLSGFQYTHKLGADKKQELTFQLLDSRTQSFSTLYSGITDSVTASKYAAAVVLNWRGNMFNDFWQTIWSYSVFNEANQYNMNYIALGNTFNFSKKFQVNYDLKFSQEDLDRKTIVTDMAKKKYGDNVKSYEGSQYLEHWLQLNYRFAEKWNLAVIGMTSAASWKNTPEKPGTYEKLRDAYGFIPAVEYYPYEDLNLRFYVNYIGRWYQYSDYSKQNGMDVGEPASTWQVNIGFVSPLLIL